MENEKIVLDDTTYAIWYLDAMEKAERYVGKTIEFTGMVMHGEEYPTGWFIPGRIAMVCCEEDVAFLGYPCRWDGENTMRDQQWVRVTARFALEDWFEYEGQGPVLYAETIERVEAPEQLVINIR